MSCPLFFSLCNRESVARLIRATNHAESSLKVLIDLFQKVAGSKDSVLGRGPQSAKSPLTSEEFLFLLLFLLDKGEKEELNLCSSFIL